MSAAAAPAGPSSPPPPPPPANASPPAPAALSPDVLDLLRGPTDERRLVGLLLAVKSLPSAGNDGLAAAREAVGAQFLERLLLPVADGVEVKRESGGRGKEDRRARPVDD